MSCAFTPVTLRTIFVFLLLAAQRPGVNTPGVKRDISTVTPVAVFTVRGNPDWEVVTDDAVWVANEPLHTVHRLDVKTNTVAANIIVGKRPCSGLAAGFGSVWAPSCGDKSLVRIDTRTNTVSATIPVGPADSEGGIAASADAIWMLTDARGELSRIDPKNNSVVARVNVPPGSASCLYANGAIWITTPAKNLLTRVDAKSKQVTDSVPVGPRPRFQTFGDGAIWTLNQGDGTVSRVDTKSRKVVASIETGAPGDGGEIAFGLGRVWTTMMQIPLTEIDPATNRVVRQWVGPGGDSVRTGHGSIWLTDLKGHKVWRIDPKQF